jgi:putative DNA primase/helicase
MSTRCSWAVENGVIDLRTGELRDGRRGDRVTYHAPVVFDAAATCPLWMKFLQRVQPAQEMRDYLQRFTGYCLTGDVSEEMLAFFYGVGANGKSTFTHAMKHLLGGDLFKQAPKGLLLKSTHERHTTEVADLCGSRMVVSTEVDDGSSLAEMLLKWLTGTPIFPDSLTNRFDGLVKRAGLRRIRLHDLRHTYATITLADPRGDVKTVSE